MVINEIRNKIMNLIMKGYSNQEIARTLGLSMGTTKYYVTTIMKMLKAKNRVHAAAIIRDLEYEYILDFLYDFNVAKLPICPVREKDDEGNFEPRINEIDWCRS